jgi:hypothetical protein
MLNRPTSFIFPSYGKVLQTRCFFINCTVPPSIYSRGVLQSSLFSTLQCQYSTDLMLRIPGKFGGCFSFCPKTVDSRKEHLSYITICSVIRVPSCTCLCLPVPACTCLYLPVPACTCLYLPVSACTCLYLPVPSCTCLYPAVSARTVQCTILNIPVISILFCPLFCTKTSSC